MLIFIMPRCLFALVSLLIAPPLFGQVWQMETSGTTAGLRGVHAVGGGVVWASGTDGTVLRTEDSGYMWQTCAMPPGAERLDFRAIWAWDANTAVVMSSGTGELSRLYKTIDGCSHWTLLYTNPDKDGFWDAIAFNDEKQGYIFGDPVQSPGRNAKEFQLFVTHDDGTTWSRQVEDFYDEMGVKEGAGAFAASNTSLCLVGHRFWLGTGGRPGAFVFIADLYRNAPAHSVCDCIPSPPNEGWVTHRVAVPLAGGIDTAGIFSIVFQNDLTGVTVGGDYSKPSERTGNAAWTGDGGEHWSASTKPPGGYRSAVAWGAELKLWITVGPNGSDLSRDDGKTWELIEHAPADIGKGGEWNALSLPWVVGPNGRIAKLNAEALPKDRSRILPPSGARARHTY